MARRVQTARQVVALCSSEWVVMLKDEDAFNTDKVHPCVVSILLEPASVASELPE